MPKRFIERSQNEDREERDPLLVRIGHTIKRLRADANMSQRQLADAADVSQPHLMLVELGGPAISVLMLNNIARVFGVPISVFFEETDPYLSIGPVLGKLAADLRRLDTVLEDQRDTVSTLLNDIVKELEQLEAAKLELSEETKRKTAKSIGTVKNAVDSTRKKIDAAKPPKTRK